MKAELSPLGTRLLGRAAQAPAHQVREFWAPPAGSQGHRAAGGGGTQGVLGDNGQPPLRDARSPWR